MAVTLTRRSRALALALAALGGTLVLWSTATLVAADQTIEFELKNTTGRDAKDLHLVFNTSIRTVTQNPANTFSSVEGIGKNQLDLKGGTVKSGDSLKLTVTGDSNKTKLNNWWWTDANGRKLTPGANPGCRQPSCSLVTDTTTPTTEPPTPTTEPPSAPPPS